MPGDRSHVNLVLDEFAAHFVSAVGSKVKKKSKGILANEAPIRPRHFSDGAAHVDSEGSMGKSTCACAKASDARPDGECVAKLQPWRDTRTRLPRIPGYTSTFGYKSVPRRAPRCRTAEDGTSRLFCALTKMLAIGEEQRDEHRERIWKGWLHESE